MPAGLTPYHVAWLGAHPARSADWLLARLRDGFEVHHVDGGHGNNDPANLVLIDGQDHAMLHGQNRLARVRDQMLLRKDRTRSSRETRRDKVAAEAYDLRRRGLAWSRIAKTLGLAGDAEAKLAAQEYASEAAMSWPPAGVSFVKLTAA